MNRLSNNIRENTKSPNKIDTTSEHKGTNISQPEDNK